MLQRKKHFSKQQLRFALFSKYVHPLRLFLTTVQIYNVQHFENHTNLTYDVYRKRLTKGVLALEIRLACEVFLITWTAVK